ncbi:MAG: tRNA (cytidine(34)-2'-O)-methyltransferase [Sphaerochaetaceae bacterium]|nr:tRNA (cytidine(34)-2'-O)-methyltransferase [Sphaerochaetaceae bacterium]MDC7238339.1 tRNA (cytidine(34)-2'-O)-methyltransferase [Sphaerochaetaceae bacterium]MDC7250447.1 tRNA (cytidine(34)-2'-O)-methyltransferase [Sphaerochaetaceae bacterium]
MSLHLVLFEPRIPQNTGNIIRTCAVIGAKLDLVHPLGFSIDEKHVKRAGLDYFDKVDVTEWKNTQEFLDAKINEKLYFFTTKARLSYHEAKYEVKGDTYLIFGREDKGIDEDILVNHKDECVRIPMKKELRSLNLSNSVAIAAYEYLRQIDFEGLEEKGNLHRLNWDD